MHTELATPTQRSTLLRLLKQQGYVPVTISSSTRTGPRFRPLFHLAGTPEPAGNPATDILTWPTLDSWVDSLTIKQASAVLAKLMDAILED